MTQDEAVAEYQKTYEAAARATDDVDFMLGKIGAVYKVLHHQWKTTRLPPDVLGSILNDFVAAKAGRADSGLNSDWPKGGDIHNALTSWRRHRGAVRLAWESVPDHRRRGLSEPGTLDRGPAS